MYKRQIFFALVGLSKAKLDAAALEALRAEPDPEPDDLEAVSYTHLTLPTSDLV